MPGTIRDIRKLTGLSLSTISKYLNGGNVLPENRKSIEKAIAELGYEVNEVARWLATNKTKTIGVLVYNIQSLFNGMLLSYIGSSLHTLGYGMLICDSADNPEQETRNIQFLLNKKVDGILAIPVNGERHEFGYAEKVGVPVVLIDRPIEGKCCVKINNSLAARQATELLLDNNHTKIAIIGSNPEYTGRRRCDGFFSAMTLAGLKVGENLIKIDRASIQFGYKSMRQLLNLKERPTAVFMTNYEITLGGVMALNESEVRCPEDISLLGFDNLILSQIVKPKMTMVVQPMKEISEKAVDILIQSLNSGVDSSSYGNINLSTTIEFGNSIRKL